MVRQALMAAVGALALLTAPPAYADQQLRQSATMTVHVADIEVARDEVRQLLPRWQAQALTDDATAGHHGPVAAFLRIELPPAALEQAVRTLATIGDLQDQHFSTDDLTQDLAATQNNVLTQQFLLRQLREEQTRATTLDAASSYMDAEKRAVEALTTARAQLARLREATSSATLNLTLTNGQQPIDHVVEEGPGPGRPARDVWIPLGVLGVGAAVLGLFALLRWDR